MFTFILRRLLSGAVLLLAISLLTFTMLYSGGGNIARRMLGETASQAVVDLKTHELGLDRPALVQYFDWLGKAITGNLGRSWYTGQEVGNAIVTRLAVSLSIVLGAIILTALVSVVLGVWAALNRGWVDKLVQLLSLLGSAIPGFLIALGLVLLFAINLGWFKPTGYVSIATSFTGWLSTVTLPIIALATGGVAGVAQQVRGSVIDTLRQDYVRTLRSRGLPHSTVVFQHVLRNAGGPALSVLALLFVAMLGGAVIIEQVFAIPGLGQFAVIATGQSDIPLVMGLVMAIGAIVVVVNLIIDLLHGWMNPKVRLS